MKPNKKDIDFTKYGLENASTEVHGKIEDITTATKVIHSWRQQGPRLYCVACPWEHATEPRFTNSILVGTDEQGLPILKKV